jgi:hypothetical protein
MYRDRFDYIATEHGREIGRMCEDRTSSFPNENGTNEERIVTSIARCGMLALGGAQTFPAAPELL